NRLAAVAHLVARQGILAARDREHAESVLAIGTGDDRLDAGHTQRLADVDLEDLGVRIGAAIDARRERLAAQQIARVGGSARHLPGPVDHRQIAADGAPRDPVGALAHGWAAPLAMRSAACRTASMIFT